MRMPMRLLVCLMIGAVLWSQERPTLYSPEKEAALGAQLANELRQKTTAANPAIQSYVDRLGRKLAARFSNGDITYKFTVVTDSLGGGTHEPLTLPGGYVFVSTSLLAAVQDEAEFAGMLAHALSHIANRDSARMGTHMVNYGSIPLIFLGGWGVANETNGAIPVGFLKTQRTYELEADRQAVAVMSAAQYDPAALVRYVSREQRPDSVFSSLPPRAERTNALEAAIRELPPGEFERFKNDLRETETQRQRQAPSLLR